MEYKYGVYPKSQIVEFKQRMHSWVFWFLLYVEQKQPKNNVNQYFEKIQQKMDGINSLFNYPTQIIEIMGLLESAKIEYNKSDFHFDVYRKIIFDIHELIDRIPDGD